MSAGHGPGLIEFFEPVQIVRQYVKQGDEIVTIDLETGKLSLYRICPAKTAHSFGDEPAELLVDDVLLTTNALR